MAVVGGMIQADAAKPDWAEARRSAVGTGIVRKFNLPLSRLNPAHEFVVSMPEGTHVLKVAVNAHRISITAAVGADAGSRSVEHRRFKLLSEGEIMSGVHCRLHAATGLQYVGIVEGNGPEVGKHLFSTFV